jgi:hypothetical protein
MNANESKELTAAISFIAFAVACKKLEKTTDKSATDWGIEIALEAAKMLSSPEYSEVDLFDFFDKVFPAPEVNNAQT